MAQIIIAPEYQEPQGPIIFLAGPITAAPRWQDHAIGYLDAEMTGAIASPRRPIRGDKEFEESDFEDQVVWEHHYLEIAAKNGVTLFWLAKPARIIPGHVYAQTTRFELGEAMAHHHLRHIRLVVGIEAGFPGEKYIRYTLAKKVPKVLVVNTLTDVCDAALQLLP